MTQNTYNMEVFEQTKIVSYLKEAYRLNRLASSMFFHGPKGSGKKFAALNFAKLLNCDNKSPELTPCEKCVPCKKISQNIHPDILTIEPINDIIRIDQIRNIISFTNFKSFESNYKIIIINFASKMNLEAQNALLKILEDPPFQTYFILISESKETLLPTIRSRCQLLTFQKPLNKDFIENLIKQKKIETKDAAFLSALINYDLFKLDDFDLSQYKIFRSTVLNFLDHIDAKKILEENDLFTKDKENNLKFLDFLFCYFRDMLVYKLNINENFIINIDIIDKIKVDAKQHSIDETIGMLYKLIELRRKLHSNINPILAFENLFL